MPFFGRRGNRARYGGPRMNLGGMRRFSTMRSFRPHKTRNRYEQVFSPTAGTEFQGDVVVGVEAPADRANDVRAGSTLTSLIVNLRATAQVAGKHQALLVYKPAAENIATAIAAYWDATDPLTEEGVKMRRLAMSRCQTRLMTADSGVTPHKFFFKWRGRKHIYDGDSISVDILDAGTTVYNGEVWLTFEG